ncbi:MBL fold metallo-hydrolase [bacterium]|nr:MBL fold metallo-hydrolase [bacterium]
MFRGAHERLAFGRLQGIRVGRFHTGVNSAAVVFRLGTTLIEAGPPNRWKQVRQFATEQPVETVLITHHHEDHSGNAGHLRQQFGARVLAPEEALAPLRDGFPIHFYRRVMWGVPPRVEAEGLKDFARFEDASGNRWQAIPCPGHSPDMCSFLETREGWLFSADLYVASRVRYAPRGHRLDQEVESLDRVLALPFAELFCAHRGHVAGGRQALLAKRDYLAELLARAQDLRRRGYSVREISGRLLGAEDYVSLLTGFHFCKANLLRACLQD